MESLLSDVLKWVMKYEQGFSSF